VSNASDRVAEQLDRLRTSLVVRQILAVVLVFVIIAVTYFGLGYVSFRIGPFADRFPSFVEFIGGFFPPDFWAFTLYTKNAGIHGLEAIWASVTNPSSLIESVVTESRRITLVRASLVTLLLGFLGTVLAFLPALVLGVPGSERVTPFPFNFVFRGIMSAIRAIPAIVWIFPIGNLGRLFTDELEEIEEGSIEAIRSTGASGVQTVVFGMLSQVSLGVVGAGGLGFYTIGQKQ